MSKNRKMMSVVVLALAGLFSGYILKHNKQTVSLKPGWVMSNFALQTSPADKHSLIGISFTLLPPTAPGATLHLQGHIYPCTPAADKQNFDCTVNPAVSLAHDGLKTLHIVVNKKQPAATTTTSR